MKITKTQLKQIILEEIEMFEADDGEEIMAAISDVPKAAEGIANKVKAEIETLAEPSGLDPLVLSQAVAALLTAD
jgi:hypothetical protein|tara:strand:+ start:203 stop:427 length:225 start_codon:yes stop_codon:yes gene_type:complete